MSVPTSHSQRPKSCPTRASPSRAKRSWQRCNAAAWPARAPVTSRMLPCSRSGPWPLPGTRRPSRHSTRSPPASSRTRKSTRQPSRSRLFRAAARTLLSSASTTGSQASSPSPTRTAPWPNQPGMAPRRPSRRRLPGSAHHSSWPWAVRSSSTPVSPLRWQRPQTQRRAQPSTRAAPSKAKDAHQSWPPCTLRCHKPRSMAPQTRGALRRPRAARQTAANRRGSS